MTTASPRTASLSPDAQAKLAALHAIELPAGTFLMTSNTGEVALGFPRQMASLANQQPGEFATNLFATLDVQLMVVEPSRVSPRTHIIARGHISV